MNLPFLSMFALTNLLRMKTEPKKHKRAHNKETDILIAAEHEFLLKGYAGARTTSIAEAAGVTHAMLHYYFRTKEELFNRILDEKMRLMGESILPVFGHTDRPILERICNGIEQHFDFVASNPDLPRFLVNEVLTYPERFEVMKSRIQLISGQLVQVLQSGLDESARRGETEPIDAWVLILDIVSLNIFTFIGYPIVWSIFGSYADSPKQFLEIRRAENVEIIMRRLKKTAK